MDDLVDYEGYQRFFTKLSTLLPVFLCNLPRVRNFSLFGPRSGAQDRGRRHTQNEQLRAMLSRVVADSMTTFHLESLRSLLLYMPAAYDFSTLLEASRKAFHTSAGDIFDKLTSLDVTLSDGCTGNNWQRCWTRAKISDTMHKYPNQTYVKDFFELLSHATNLQELAVESTDCLRLDMMNTSALRKLRCLSLSGFFTPGTTLRDLIMQNKASLTYLRLVNIRLETGTWEAVLDPVDSLGHLVYLYLESCGYCPTAGTYYAANGGAPLGTTRDGDRRALEDAVYTVLETRSLVGDEAVGRKTHMTEIMLQIEPESSSEED